MRADLQTCTASLHNRLLASLHKRLVASLHNRLVAYGGIEAKSIPASIRYGCSLPAVNTY